MSSGWLSLRNNRDSLVEYSGMSVGWLSIEDKSKIEFLFEDILEILKSGCEE